MEKPRGKKSHATVPLRVKKSMSLPGSGDTLGVKISMSLPGSVETLRIKISLSSGSIQKLT